MGVTEERENCNEIEVGIREDPPAERFEIEGDLPGMVELSVSGRYNIISCFHQLLLIYWANIELYI